MKDSKIVPIANTCDLAEDTPFPEEGGADVSSGWNAAQEGSVEFVKANANRSEGNSRNDCLRFSVGTPIPFKRFGRRGNCRV
jgi:hypothetical protein